MNKIEISPRIWSAAAVARRLGMSAGTFGKRLGELVSVGFPSRDPILRGWDSAAIERWLDHRSGIVDHNPAPKDSGLGSVQW
jgi:hypothetical protein